MLLLPISVTRVLTLERRLAQSVALWLGFQCGIPPLLGLSPEAISHPAGCSFSPQDYFPFRISLRKMFLNRPLLT
jgi:hypothetical protein